ncbi:MAG TPA: nitrogen regulation protein NR(I), partial [Xanthomonadaceae bacterium]|nr:nitrogen regulation protein NR(I) [Xanthomonadaceae bacterium]
MSAYTDVASTAGAFRGGAHEFLSKPFDLDDAVALAARALPEDEAPGGPDAGVEPASATGTNGTPQWCGDPAARNEVWRGSGRLVQ